MAKLAVALIATCHLAACTTGGKISLAATTASVMGFAGTFKLELLCSPELGGCPDNTAAGVFALTAAAAALTGITFEVIGLIRGDDAPAKPVAIAPSTR